MNVADAVVSDAEVIHRYYLETYGKFTEIIAYGVEPLSPLVDESNLLKKYGLSRDGYFLYTARLEPENMAHVVLQAHRMSGCNRPLVIVGDAPYANAYIDNIKAHCSGNVLFLGGIYGNDYRLLKSNCFSYIQAGEVGGTHPALLEGMAWAPMVVANDVEEHLEVGKDSIQYYKKNHVRNLAEILCDLEKHPAKRIEFSLKAKKENSKSLSMGNHYRPIRKTFSQTKKHLKFICIKEFSFDRYLEVLRLDLRF